MNKSKFAGILIAAAVIGGSTLLAKVSTDARVSAVIEGSRVNIFYGRPFTKDPKTGEPRKIWGGLVPYGKIWRTGADEATTLISQKPLDFGGTVVPGGVALTLFTVPEENGGKLIISKAIGGWGLQYPKPGDELARVDLKREPMDKTLDQFNIVVAKNPGGGGVIKLQWEDAQYTATFTVQK